MSSVGVDRSPGKTYSLLVFFSLVVNILKARSVSGILRLAALVFPLRTSRYPFSRSISESLRFLISSGRIPVSSISTAKSGNGWLHAIKYIFSSAKDRTRSCWLSSLKNFTCETGFLVRTSSRTKRLIIFFKQASSLFTVAGAMSFFGPLTFRGALGMLAFLPRGRQNCRLRQTLYFSTSFDDMRSRRVSLKNRNKGFVEVSYRMYVLGFEACSIYDHSRKSLTASPKFGAFAFGSMPTSPFASCV